MDERAGEYKPLYLKYRPQSLKALVGQKSVVKTLANALENNKIAHAYLFTGPRGTGKTSSARILAKSINCDKGPTTDPCLKCSSCEAIANSSSTSVFEIDAASNNSVDDARALIERAPLATQDGKHKLYIIDECHMLTKEAFNALLKTIEEPPPQVVFILATTEEHKVPPTIVSRCQRLMFRLVSHEELKDHLGNVAGKESINISENALDLMARRSGGGLRDALGLLDQASLLARPDVCVEAEDLLVLLGALDEEVLLDISQGIKELDGHAVLSRVNQLLLDGREPSLISSELAKHFLALTKGAYLANTQAPDNSQFITGSKTYIERVIEQAKAFDRSELSQIVEMLGDLEIRIKRSSQPSLTLEIGILSICHRVDLASVKILTEKVKRLEAIIESGDFDQVRQPRIAKPTASKTVAESQPQEKEIPRMPREAPVEKPQLEKEIVRVEEEAGENLELKQEKESKKEQEQDRKPENEPEKPTDPPESPRETSFAEDDQDEATPASAPVDLSELEELWSDLLDAVHKRSIPAYSLVKTHANPLNLENNQLTLGVSKEFFQKSIEGKASHLQEAYKDLTGKEITVKVKVVKEEEATKKKSSPEPKPAVAPVKQARPADNRETVNSAPERSKTISESAGTSQIDKKSDHEIPPPSPKNGSDRKENKDSQSTQEEESTLVNEAYRIFEGPGSRIIG